MMPRTVRCTSAVRGSRKVSESPRALATISDFSSGVASAFASALASACVLDAGLLAGLLAWVALGFTAGLALGLALSAAAAGLGASGLAATGLGASPAVAAGAWAQAGAMVAPQSNEAAITACPLACEKLETRRRANDFTNIHFQIRPPV